MPGFSNNVIYGGNVDFSGSNPPSPQVLNDGELLIGSSTAPNIRVATLTAGTGVTITNGNGTITISAPGGGSGVSSITGTANQVFANGTSGSAQTGSITLTLPQDIATISNVQFGKLGLGTSANSNAALTTQSTLSYNLLLNGTQTAQTGNNEYSLYVNSTLAPAASASGFVSAIGIDVTYNPANTTTTTNATGIYVKSNAQGAAGGTITNAYSAYFEAPTAGASKNAALYTANAAIGYTATTPPSNGLVVSGNTSIGSSTATSLFNVGSSNQFQINATGVVTSGTWNGSVIDLGHGGTNANLTASNGGIFYSTATAGAILAGTATANQILLSGSSSAPSWSTATYPATTTANQILYSSANNTITGIATGNNGVLITSAGGVPSISSTLPNAVQANITTVGTVTAGTWNATTIAVDHGGTGQTSYTDGQLLIGNSTGNTLTKSTLTAGTGISIVNGAGSITISASGTAGVSSITGTANQVLANGTSGSQESGDVTLTLPQDIATSSSVQFGKLGLGTGASSSAILTSQSTLAYNLLLNGTQTAQTGNNEYSLYVNSTLAPAADATGFVSAIGVNVTYDPANTTTTTNATGIYVKANAQGAAGGTITNAYGAYFEAPTAGASKNAALYTANAAIGYTATTPPSNGLVVSGNTSIGSSSATSLFNVGSSNQFQINATGVVTSGTWNGSVIDLAHGGTNANLTASNGGIFYSTATGGAILAGTATANQILLSGSSSAPSWSTATYPATTTANQILYSSANNTITGIATGNNGVLITSAGGVPSISSTLPNAVQTNITTVGTVTSGTWNATTLAVNHGGTGQTSYTDGQLLIGNSIGNTLTKSTLTAGTGVSITNGNGSITIALDSTAAVTSITGTANQVLANGTSGTPETGDVTLTLPQDIATSSSVQFGKLGLGTSASSSAILTSQSTLAYNLLLNGTQTAQTGNNEYSLYVNSTLAPAADATGFVSAVGVNVTYDPANTTTTTNATGIYVKANAQGSAGGTITNAYSAYFEAPTAGASKNAALYTANAAIGYTATTPPSNGLVVSGNTSIGSSSAGSLFNVGSSNQFQINATGVVTSGTWNGSVIDLAHGGTNANLTASNGGIFYSTATAGAILAGTATANQILLSGANDAPSWSTATYPATTTANQILYSSANNTIAGIATGNNGVLITSAGGVPSISSTLPNAVQTNITTVGTVTSGTWNATTIAVNHGGTGQTSYTDGQLLIGNSSGNTLTKSTLTAGTGISIVNGAGSITISASGTAGVSSITGTANQVLANGTSGSQESGDVTLTLPQDIATSSSVQFGKLGLGTSASSSAVLTSQSTLAYNLLLNGTQTAQTGNNEYSLYVNSTLAPAANATGFVSAVGIDVSYDPANTTTTTNASGLYVKANAQGAAGGTITNAYGAYIEAPTVGASKNAALYTANAAIGYTATTPPSNGLIVSGNTSIGSSSATSLFNVGSSNQFQINATGVVTSGTWNGSVIDLAHGGTNANLTASNGGIFYSTATAGAILAGTATANQILLSGANDAPSWSTATYPATTTANQILYSSANNTIAGITTGNNGVLITSAGGVPSISSTLPNAVQANITTVGTVTSGTWNATTIAVNHGGTGQTSYTDGQLLIGNSTGNTLTKSTLTAGTGVSITNGNGSITIALDSTAAVTSITGTANQVLANGTSGTPETGDVTLTLPQDIATSSSVQFGKLGLGTSTSSSAILTSQSTLAYNLLLNGTQTAQTGNNEYSLYVNSTLAPAADATGFVSAVGINVTYDPANTTTTTNATGIYVKANAQGAAGGTITNAYGAYFEAPTVGASKNAALYTANAAIGYTATTPPSNGLVVSGNTSIGSSSATSLFNVGSSNQFQINATGVVTSGTWNGSVIDLAHGGTNANLTANNGGIFYSTATAGAILAGTATANQVLLSGANDAPSWSTATYPATTTANQILYSSADNTIAGITTGNNGVLITSAGGVPSISSTLPNAVQANITTVGTVTSGTWNATTIAVNRGGTGQTSYTDGQLLIGNSTGNTLTKSTLTAGTGVSITNGNGSITIALDNTAAVTSITGTANQVLANGTSGTPETGDVTLTLPQDIATSSSVQFGKLGLGTSASSSAILTSQSTLAYNLLLNGTQTAQTGNNEYSLYVNSTLAPAADATGFVSAIGVDVTYNPANTTTTTNATGIYVKANAQGAAGGTITNAYSAYFEAPTAGTSKNAALYTTNAAIGYTATTPPSNGLVVNGNTSIGSSSATSLFNVGSSNQFQINATGVVTSGTWQGTVVGLAYGGTNANLTASNGGIFYSTATAGAILAGTATANQVLLSGSNSAPSWSTATYPATTTANQILYSSANNTIAGITTGNNGVLITSAGGVPSISSTLPAAVQGNITTVGTISSGTWQGTTIGVAYGGTGQTSYTDGQLLIGNSTGNTLTKATLTEGTGVSITNGNGSITIAIDSTAAVTSITGTANQVLANGTSGTPETGDVTLTLPQDIATSSSVQFGKLGLGTSGSSSAILTSQSTLAYNLLLNGTQTAQTGNNEYSLYVNSTLAPAADATGFVSAIGVNVTYDPANTTTTTNATGIYVKANAQGASGGTITNAYGAYFEAPTAGTSKNAALYTANAAIGYTATTPPSNGLVVSGNTSIGSSSATSLFNVGSSNQFQINATGVVTSGTWNGSVIDLAHGGTNANLTASNGGIFYSTATAGAILAGTATANQILLSGANDAPSWSTATYPATTTVNQILYSSADNTIAGITTGNNGVLITSAGGVPSISSTLPNAVQANITTVGTVTSGTWNATTIAVNHGGTGQTSYTDGQLLIGNSTGNTLTKSTLTAGTGVSITNGNGSITIALDSTAAVTSITGTANQVLANGTSGTPETGDVTLTLPQDIATSSSVQFGKLGLGTSASSSAILTSQSTLAYNLLLNGTQTAQTGNNEYSLYVNSTLAPAANATGFVSAIGVNVTYDPANTTTTTNATGIYVKANAQGAAGGTITNAYGAYFEAPTAGASKNAALYTANAAIGYTATTPPSNGLVVSGNTSIGSSSATSLFNVGSSNQFQINASGVVTSGTWQGTTIGVAYGGTGQTSYTDGQLLIGNSSGNTLTKATLTAGPNVTITNGNGSITIAANKMAYTAIDDTDSPYTALSTDSFISCDSTSGAITVRLPNAAASVGQIYTVKDRAGQSRTNNITVTTVGGTVEIDGATSIVINSAYASLNFLWNGTSYEIW